MDITFKGRRTTVPERFRRHAAAKLAKLEKRDQKAVRIDVEVSKDSNPRQSDRRERVELTIRSRGPAIRAEAAADDRYTALDLAFAKLESRLRRASDRRKINKTDSDTLRSPALVAGDGGVPSLPPRPLNGNGAARPRSGELDDGAKNGRARSSRGLNGWSPAVAIGALPVSLAVSVFLGPIHLINPGVKTAIPPSRATSRSAIFGARSRPTRRTCRRPR